MRGYLNAVKKSGIAGWYYKSTKLNIYINGRFCKSILANNARPDVLAQGKSIDGLGGFREKLTLHPGDVVSVRKKWTFRPLLGCPKMFLPKNFLPYATAIQLPSLKKYLQSQPEKIWGGSIPSNVEDISVRLLVKRYRYYRGHSLFTRGYIWRFKQDGQRKYVVELFKGSFFVKRILYAQNTILSNMNFSFPKLIQKPERLSWLRSKILFEYKPGFHHRSKSLGSLLISNKPLVLQIIRALSELSSCQTKKRMYNWLCMSTYLFFDYRYAVQALLRFRFKELLFILRLIPFIVKSPKVFSHGDLHAKNILISKDSSEVTFIDWEVCGYYPIGYDLARIFGDIGINEARPLIEYYAAHLKINIAIDLIEKTFWIYVYLRLLKRVQMEAQRIEAIKNRINQLTNAKPKANVV